MHVEREDMDLGWIQGETKLTDGDKATNLNIRLVFPVRGRNWRSPSWLTCFFISKNRFNSCVFFLISFPHNLTLTPKYCRSVTTNTSTPGKTRDTDFFQRSLKVFISIILREMSTRPLVVLVADDNLVTNDSVRITRITSLICTNVVSSVSWRVPSLPSISLFLQKSFFGNRRSL